LELSFPVMRSCTGGGESIWDIKNMNESTCYFFLLLSESADFEPEGFTFPRLLHSTRKRGLEEF
jgi:hypothetical protein